MVLTKQQYDSAAETDDSKLGKLFETRSQTQCLLVQCAADREIQTYFHRRKKFSCYEAYRYNCYIVHNPQHFLHRNSIKNHGWPLNVGLKEEYNQFVKSATGHLLPSKSEIGDSLFLGDYTAHDDEHNRDQHETDGFIGDEYVDDSDTSDDDDDDEEVATRSSPDDTEEEDIDDEVEYYSDEEQDDDDSGEEEDVDDEEEEDSDEEQEDYDSGEEEEEDVDDEELYDSDEEEEQYDSSEDDYSEVYDSDEDESEEELNDEVHSLLHYDVKYHDYYERNNRSCYYEST